MIFIVLHLYYYYYYYYYSTHLLLFLAVRICYCNFQFYTFVMVICSSTHQQLLFHFVKNIIFSFLILFETRSRVRLLASCVTVYLRTV